MTTAQRATQVYFIKPVGFDGPIKIGCSCVPTERLVALTLWSPFRLEIIGSIAGTWLDERFLHKCFSQFHSHGEWFHPSRVLRDEINNILEHGISYARSNLTPTGDIRSSGYYSRSDQSRARMSKSMREAWARRKQMLAEKARADAS